MTHVTIDKLSVICDKGIGDPMYPLQEIDFGQAWEYIFKYANQCFQHNAL